MSKKYFPINTKTACSLKWSWSTLYMDRTESASCHRTGFYPLTVENFDNFHNNPKVLAERIKMLNGEWPQDSCQYCRSIEQEGGFSDRMHHLTIPDQVPIELDSDLTAIRVTPTILEIFFNRLCNMACLYCVPGVSSRLNQEYEKFGPFDKDGIKLIAVPKPPESKELMDELWKWLDKNLINLKRLNILGGEPTFQPEFYQLLDFLESKEHPNLELEIVTNLKVDPDRLDRIIGRLKSLAAQRKIKRLDIICSIDCWGPEQEYIRYGMNLDKWEKNFERLIAEKWIRITINLTISVLSVKTTPALLKKLADWNKQFSVNMSFSGCTPGPTYMMFDILGAGVFDEDFENILKLMPAEKEEHQVAIKYMNGLKNLSNKPRNNEEVKKLHTFLNEKDQRNNTNWQITFPWLKEEFKKCGIVV